MLLRLMILLVAALPMSAAAEIYTWTDAAGTVNFTEDLGAIPKQYRKKATRVGSDDSSPPQAVPAPTTTKEPAAKAPAAAPATAKTPTAKEEGAAAAPATTKDAVYDGKKGSEWQVEFKQRRAQVAALEQQIKEFQAETAVARTQAISTSRAAEINARGAALQKQYNEAAAGLNQLVERANRASLPEEFSR